jgi:isopenicillin N synthase-like dioxygenase
MSPVNSRRRSPLKVFDQIRDEGFGIVHLDTAESEFLAALHREVGEFFASSGPVKLRNSTPNRASGYRPCGHAHSGSPHEPDLNDSFLYWGRRRESLPHPGEIASLLDAFEAYRVVAAGIAHGLIDDMREYYDHGHELPFENASVLQANSFDMVTDSEFLQHSHEDAVLFTLIWASAKGLEIVVDGEARSIDFAPDEVLVMAGSLMDAMTGGEVRPLYHQVRNYGRLGRKSLMYFVSPDVTGPVAPFVTNDHNRAVDIRGLVLSNPRKFGLSEEFMSP